MANQANAPKVTVIDPATPEKAKLRVAAYARVSSDSADQLNSYLAQVDYYTRHIGENPDWELADIYADEGISGLDTRKRDEFNRMLADCRSGKIDRILVKSMSRFARNTRDSLHFMRELMRLGITIRFEKENIDTGKLSSEQTATIYAAFAQMESTGHSSNMRLSVRMRMEKGIFTPSSMPYGYRLNGLEPEIVPEEAQVVRQIFAAALQGQGHTDITKRLNESGIDRGHGRERWHCSMVSYILSNRFYTGDSDWQKTCATDTLPFKQVKNRGQKPRYQVEDDHPGIIDRENFQRVQELIAARKERFYRGSTPSDSVYTGHIFCGHCGCACRKKVTRGMVHWVCNRRNDSKELCPIPQIPEAVLTAATLRLHNKLALHAAELLQPLLDQLRDIRERELRSNQRLSDIDKEIANISGQNLVLIRLKSKGCIDSALALSQADGLGRRLRDLRRLRRKVLEAADGDEQIQTTEAMLDYLEGAQWQTEVTPELFENLVERILENSKYIGADNWPRLVSDEDFTAAQRLRTERSTYAPLSTDIRPIQGKVVCGLCGGKMIRGNRSHGLVHWKCQNPGCGQSISLNDEALAGLVDGLLRELAQAPHLLIIPEPRQTGVDMEAVRLQNELTLALNRGDENPGYIKTLAMAAAAQRYSQIPDPTPAHDLEQLRARLEEGPADANTLSALLDTAVRAVRLAPDKTVDLELVNGQIITEAKEESA